MPRKRSKANRPARNNRKDNNPPPTLPDGAPVLPQPQLESPFEREEVIQTSTEQDLDSDSSTMGTAGRTNRKLGHRKRALNSHLPRNKPPSQDDPPQNNAPPNNSPPQNSPSSQDNPPQNNAPPQNNPSPENNAPPQNNPLPPTLPSRPLVAPQPQQGPTLGTREYNPSSREQDLDLDSVRPQPDVPPPFPAQPQGSMGGQYHPSSSSTYAHSQPQYPSSVPSNMLDGHWLQPLNHAFTGQLPEQLPSWTGSETVQIPPMGQGAVHMEGPYPPPFSSRPPGNNSHQRRMSSATNDGQQRRQSSGTGGRRGSEQHQASANYGGYGNQRRMSSSTAGGQYRGPTNPSFAAQQRRQSTATTDGQYYPPSSRPYPHQRQRRQSSTTVDGQYRPQLFEWQRDGHQPRRQRSTQSGESYSQPSRQPYHGSQSREQRQHSSSQSRGQHSSWYSQEQPGGPSQHSEGPSQHSGGPSQQPEGPSQQPEGPSQHSGGPSQQPEGPSQHSGGPSQQPGGSSQHSGGSSASRSRWFLSDYHDADGETRERWWLEVSAQMGTYQSQLSHLSTAADLAGSREERLVVLRAAFNGHAQALTFWVDVRDTIYESENLGDFELWQIAYVMVQQTRDALRDFDAQTRYQQMLIEEEARGIFQPVRPVLPVPTAAYTQAMEEYFNNPDAYEAAALEARRGRQAMNAEAEPFSAEEGQTDSGRSEETVTQAVPATTHDEAGSVAEAVPASSVRASSLPPMARKPEIEQIELAEDGTASDLIDHSSCTPSVAAPASASSVIEQSTTDDEPIRLLDVQNEELFPQLGRGRSTAYRGWLINSPALPPAVLAPVPQNNGQKTNTADRKGKAKPKADINDGEENTTADGTGKGKAKANNNDGEEKPLEDRKEKGKTKANNNDSEGTATKDPKGKGKAKADDEPEKQKEAKGKGKEKANNDNDNDKATADRKEKAKAKADINDGEENTTADRRSFFTSNITFAGLLKNSTTGRGKAKANNNDGEGTATKDPKGKGKAKADDEPEKQKEAKGKGKAKPDDALEKQKEAKNGESSNERHRKRSNSLDMGEFRTQIEEINRWTLVERQRPQSSGRGRSAGPASRVAVPHIDRSNTPRNASSGTPKSKGKGKKKEETKDKKGEEAKGNKGEEAKGKKKEDTKDKKGGDDSPGPSSTPTTARPQSSAQPQDPPQTPTSQAPKTTLWSDIFKKK